MPPSTDDLLCEAIPVYIGMGHRSSPHEDRQALKAKYGPELSAVLVERIDSVLMLTSEIPSGEYLGMTQTEVVNRLMGILDQKYPFLTPLARASIEWSWSFRFR